MLPNIFPSLSIVGTPSTLDLHILYLFSSYFHHFTLCFKAADQELWQKVLLSNPLQDFLHQRTESMLKCWWYGCVWKSSRRRESPWICVWWWLCETQWRLGCPVQQSVATCCPGIKSWNTDNISGPKIQQRSAFPSKVGKTGDITHP